MRALTFNEANNTAGNAFSQIHIGIKDKNKSDKDKKNQFYVFLQAYDPSFDPKTAKDVYPRFPSPI